MYDWMRNLSRLQSRFTFLYGDGLKALNVQNEEENLKISREVKGEQLGMAEYMLILYNLAILTEMSCFGRI